MEQSKRKARTKTSSAVKMRHIRKTYKQYSLAFRFDSDADIIEAFETAKEQGIFPAELVRKLIRKK